MTTKERSRERAYRLALAYALDVNDNGDIEEGIIGLMVDLLHESEDFYTPAEEVLEAVRERFQAEREEG